MNGSNCSVHAPARQYEYRRGRRSGAELETQKNRGNRWRSAAPPGICRERAGRGKRRNISYPATGTKPASELRHPGFPNLCRSTLGTYQITLCERINTKLPVFENSINIPVRQIRALQHLIIYSNRLCKLAYIMAAN